MGIFSHVLGFVRDANLCSEGSVVNVSEICSFSTEMCSLLCIKFSHNFLTKCLAGADVADFLYSASF